MIRVLNFQHVTFLREEGYKLNIFTGISNEVHKNFKGMTLWCLKCYFLSHSVFFKIRFLFSKKKLYFLFLLFIHVVQNVFFLLMTYDVYEF